MLKEAIRNSNKTGKESEFTVRKQKPNTWQEEKTNKYKNM